MARAKVEWNAALPELEKFWAVLVRNRNEIVKTLPRENPKAWCDAAITLMSIGDVASPGMRFFPSRSRRPRLARAPRELGDWVRSGEDEVSRMLGLGGSMDQKFAIVTKFLEPAGDIAGLITNDRV